MENIWIAAVVLGLAAALASMLGAALVIVHPQAAGSRLDRYLALSAGFLLAVALLELVPGALGVHEYGAHGEEQAGLAAIDPRLGSLLILAGFVSLHLVEKLFLSQHLHGHHSHGHGHPPHGAPVAAGSTVTLLGMVLHTFFDGISIGAGLAVGVETGLLIFLAVLLHKLPDGFVIGSLVLASGGTRGRVMAGTLALGAATLLGSVGAVAAIVWGGKTAAASAEALAQYGLAFAAGIFVYVAASDLIPEVTRREDRSLILWTLLGVAAFAATESVLL